MSDEDRRVLELWDRDVSFSDGHYTLPIPFKNPALTLPDNRQMAERRLSSLKRKLLKNHDLHWKYMDGMNDLLEKGYAVPVTKEDVYKNDGKIWYLPHHPVINPNKEKIRIVFDCAAEYNGISLNSKVRQGPDLTNQDALRFLWWPEGNLSKQPVSYKMTVHLFGGTWSPSCCAYALRRTAEDNSGSYSPAAVDTITQNFYVDDCLKSMPTVSEAINLVSDLKTLVAEGGFNLTKWTSKNPVDKLISGISNWTRLIRILACFTLIPEVHRTKVPFTGSLEAEHLQRAEEILIRHIQNQCYPEEIKAITRGRSIASSSPLARLRPVLQDGVLVVLGRLTYTGLPSHAKRPAILPACHPAVESLVRHVHERTAHSGRGYVLAGVATEALDRRSHPSSQEDP